MKKIFLFLLLLSFKSFAEEAPKLTYSISLPAHVVCNGETFAIAVKKGPDKVLNINFEYLGRLTSINMLVINNAVYSSADKLMLYNDETGAVAIKQMTDGSDGENFINIGFIAKEDAYKSCFEKKQMALDDCVEFENEPDFHAACLADAQRYSQIGYQLQLPVILSAGVVPSFERSYKCINKWGPFDDTRTRETLFNINLKANGVDNIYGPIFDSKQFDSMKDCKAYQDGF